MPTAVVLGAGMVGSVIARDLASEDGWSVTVVDRDASVAEAAAARAGSAATARGADVTDRRVLAELVAGADVVCGALASTIGQSVLESMLELGVPYCDIAFMPEDAIDLDARARERGATAVVDCGVAPGMSNLLVGEAIRQLDRVDRARILVGGIPQVRHLPFEYKAGFAPTDVIEEYVRPSRIVRGGRTVVLEPLTEIEPVEVEGVGTLEAFITDGLRSLVSTTSIPDLEEKTMRWPGHAALMRAFRDAGLFDLEPIDAGGTSVVPRRVAEALLVPRWTFEDGEGDVTVMRVEAEGERDGAPVRLEWELIDRYDAETGTSAMSRTTGFPCAIVARMLAAGRITTPGVLPPERLADVPGLTEDVLAALQDRGVVYRFTSGTPAG